jgi:hypothetical protein
MLCNFPVVRYHNHMMPRYPVLPTRTGLQQDQFRLLPFRSPLLGQSLLLSFPGGTKMVQFSPLPSATYEFSHGYPLRDELSHSEIPGSRCVCHSPGLIATCYVLRRQPMPRHPPYTLCILIHLFTSRRNLKCASSTRYVKEQNIETFRGRFKTASESYFSNGADRNRTCDIMLAKHALSQLSYSPLSLGARLLIKQAPHWLTLIIMGLERLELSTPSLSEKCSNQLSYRPEDPCSKNTLQKP